MAGIKKYDNILCWQVSGKARSNVLLTGMQMIQLFWQGIRQYHLIILYSFFKDFIYLFLERGKWREKERERNINVWLPLARPYWGPDPQPRHVPWLGIELVTLWFTGRHSIHRGTPARANFALLYMLIDISSHVSKLFSWQVIQKLWPRERKYE